MSHPISKDNRFSIYIGLKYEENMIKDEIQKYLSMHEEDQNEEVKFPHWQKNACSQQRKMPAAGKGKFLHMPTQGC